MKINIDITANSFGEIKLSNRQIKEIFTIYDGNLKCWVEDNISELFEQLGYELELDDVYYNDKDYKKAEKKAEFMLENKKVELLNLTNYIYNEKVIKSELTQLKIDYNMISPILPIIDVNIPKLALCYIALNNEIICTTDTKFLFVEKITSKDVTDTKFNLVPPVFIKPNAKIYKHKETDDIYMFLENKWFYSKKPNDEFIKLNTIKNLIFKESNPNYNLTYNFNDLKFSNICNEENDSEENDSEEIKIDFPNYKSLNIQKKYYEILLKLNPNEVYLEKIDKNDAQVIVFTNNKNKQYFAVMSLDIKN